MKKRFLVVFIFASILMSSNLEVRMVDAHQPPVETTTYRVGNVTLPSQFTGWSAYSYYGGELVSNVYETLIFFDRDLSKPPEQQGLMGQFVPRLAESLPTKKVITLTVQNTTTVNRINPVSSQWFGNNQTFLLKYWIDNNKVAPDGLGVNDVVYLEYVFTGEIHPYHVTSLSWGATVSMTVERIVYYFKTRTGVKFHPWTRRDGTLITTSTLDTADVEYTFEAGLIYDGLNSPQWMFYQPMFDVWSSAPWTDGTFGTGTDADFRALGRIIDDAIQRNDTYVWMSLAFPFPETAWFQILSQTWGSIVDKEMAVDYNAWNGTWKNPIDNYPVWKAWRRYPTNSLTPLDKNGPDPYGRARNPQVAADAPIMCGTGPYKFTSLDTVNQELRIDKFDNYWRGWTNFDGAHPSHVNTIILKAVPDWTTRKNGFLAGDYDIITVPRDKYSELIGVPGVVTKGNLPTGILNAMFFTSPVATGSPYMPRVGGINTPDVFAWNANGVHMRKAFAYALNRTTLKQQIWASEALVNRSTWHISGLIPDYYDYAIPVYDIDVTMIKEELQAAQFTIGAVTKSAWEWGFNISLIYNTGNNIRKATFELIKAAIEPLSGTLYNGKTAGTFTLPVVGLTMSAWWDALEFMKAPVWQVGWVADFMDAENWARGFQHSQSTLSLWQGYSNPTVDNQIDIAVKTPDGPTRRDIYYELQAIYHNDVVSVPTAQQAARVFMRDWVYGWYWNPIYPGGYFYDLWKAVPLPTKIYVDPQVALFDVPGTLTIGINIENVTDLHYWEFVLYYDNHILNVTSPTSIVEGAFLKSGGSTFFNMTFQNNYNATHGRILALGGLLSEGLGVSGSGNLAKITFKAIEPGMSSLNFGFTQLLNSLHNNIAHSALSGYAQIGPYTQTGIDVKVTPRYDVNITFNQVVSGGFTSANTIETGPPPPPGGLIGPYYDISTSASFSGTFNIAITYDDTGLTPEQENALQLIHWDDRPLPGDITGPTPNVPDGKVDIRDIALVAKYFGRTVPPAPPNCDLDHNGRIEIKDIAMVAINFGKAWHWDTVTTSRDPVHNIIYGQDNHLSIFGVR